MLVGTMVSPRVVLLFAGIVLMLGQCCVVESQPSLGTFTLGFLGPAAESEIPTKLAIEWESAFKVAVEVLNSKGRPYILSPRSEYSDCDWQKAYHGADVLLNLDPLTYPPVIGVVGPACSGAAMASSPVMKVKNISMVSFAATSEALAADRDFSDNLYRTVYSDNYQAQAIAASITKLNMTAVTVLHTKQYYSMNLAQNIQEAVAGAIPVNVVMLENGENSTLDFVQLKTVLDKHDPNTFVILVMHPQQAHDAFEALNVQGRLDNPWWYFGTDGVTALDPADEKPELVQKLLGEIGIAPFGGDYSNTSECGEYWTYWEQAGYPGRPVSGVSKSRSYTPYLLDTVHLYFVICDHLVSTNQTITAQNIWNVLKAGHPPFLGCTGEVAISPITGSRNISVQPPIYDLVSLTVDDWEAKGRIESNKFISLQPLQRPTGTVSAATADNPSKKSNAGTVVGIIFGLLLAVAIVIGGYIVWKRRQNNYYNPTSFIRTMH
ncbi:uncharacterized protein [Physcomitrium patens]|uniref:Receptor ligand binding region domain-containing protein n=1 Tax=Physcomitrium patens TaxID=3218 RepID=A0A2K1KA09_PHYPA|nr:metabotropic glutamate receptor-like protein E [Physcomitrium patens]XP_024381515.1 metabotropic glutamate receptor-like protein E [Physcomitrium patens]XP_024381516.1 metabotropic glutamate receptor-like protein E [Physcomitrium patens]XP_024381517.1 metabotropic glutamate receptor-like protein E [Physcomitrium patens]XP_024381518.1 metabotropic glutamate receptor-like protein E [Physcomitrium patens]XP_024381519.1 metabotropic glutamate receptor-like protein E [Physcomitrium patens]PNR50|eukprot:XP_024381514.1 metabotropic glutamate receptor-like protein E [Physcomitrella patens]